MDGWMDCFGSFLFSFSFSSNNRHRILFCSKQKTIAVITRNLIQYLFMQFLSFFLSLVAPSLFLLLLSTALTFYTCSCVQHYKRQHNTQQTYQPATSEKRLSYSLLTLDVLFSFVQPTLLLSAIRFLLSLSLVRAFSLLGKVRSPFVNEIALS